MGLRGSVFTSECAIPISRHNKTTLAFFNAASSLGTLLVVNLFHLQQTQDACRMRLKRGLTIKDGEFLSDEWERLVQLFG